MKYILIADDDELNQIIYTELFEDIYELSFVDDGKACIHSVEQRVPDVLLLDYSMPIMNGIEACKLLRSNESSQNLPIIMVTGHATSKVEDECILAGTTAYFSKPFNLNELLNKVDELCNK